MIVENEDSGICPREFAEEIRRGQAADAATDHDQVIYFLVGSPFRPLLAVAQVMRHFP